MKKIFIALFLIVAFLIILIPFASSNPDGLEKVVETYGAHESQSPWNGIMADYSIFSIENQYVSTLVAGILGVIVVLITGLLVSKALAQKH
jgi:hypothetical protein